MLIMNVEVTSKAAIAINAFLLSIGFNKNHQYYGNYQGAAGN
jgi:hypothetical protein